MMQCLSCGLPLNRVSGKFACDRCLEKIRLKEIDELNSKLRAIGTELSEVGAKVDSGRHTGAQVQRMHRLTKDWLDTEKRLIEAKRAV